MSSFVHTATNNLENSKDFYTRLNYKDVSSKNFTRFTDGNIHIEINPDRHARAGVKLVKGSWADEVKKLEKLVKVLPIEGGHLVRDDNGVWFYLMESDDKEELTTATEPYGHTGQCYGVCIECTDLEKSTAFLEILGFHITMSNLEHGYVNFENEDKLGICLLGAQQCPHLFFNPSLTFFNGKKNLDYIDKIKKAGVFIAEEITHFNDKGEVDNIIIRDPGGYGFFIFSD